MSANDRQVAGEHYMKFGDLQHWDVVLQHHLDYFEGQITKYVFRWREKNGLIDLEKAAHFLDKYIEVMSPVDSGTFQGTKLYPPTTKPAAFCEVASHFKLDYFQGVICEGVMRWKAYGSVGMLRESKRQLDAYIVLERAKLAPAEPDPAEPTTGYVDQD